MRESLFSPLWYRVAEQTPRLGPDVAVREQPSRGQPWYLLVAASSGRQCRLNHAAYQLVGCFDGQYTVQQIWDALLHDLRDQAPTQDEVILTLARLSEQGLLDYGGVPDIAAQFQRREKRLAQRRHANVNPLAFRVPLGDPSALLRRLDAVHRVLFRPALFWVWVGAVALALVLAGANWGALRAHADSAMGTPRYLLLAWLVFPFIKALHELGHALAVRHWGGEVLEAGIGLFVLTPAPYVDASASAGFPARHQRAGVAAMGIMVELALAALALLLWLNLQNGLLRDLAFVTMFVASVSTLLFNANPLLNFDGYYLACDALDLPNLGVRSRRYWMSLLQRAVYGGQRVARMDVAPGEAKWLAAYAPASMVYRIFLSGLIVLWVGHHSVVLGTIIAAYAAVTVLLLPLWRTVRGVLSAAPSATHSWRERAVLGCAAVGVLLLIFALPLPFHTAAWGVVWMPDQARARADTEGFVAHFAARDGEQVVPGQLLATLQDPALAARREQLAGQLVQLRSERFDLLLRDTGKALNLREELEHVAAELARVDERLALLEVRSQGAGRLVMPRQQDMIGSFVKRGSTLGYVLDRGEVGVRAAVPERDAALIRQSHVGVQVRLAEELGEAWVGALVRDVPAAGFELPGAALGDRGGGPYPTDPADKDGLRSQEPVVLIDLFLRERVLERVGGRAWVLFDHGAQPLAVQAYRRLRQLFLQHFNASA